MSLGLLLNCVWSLDTERETEQKSMASHVHASQLLDHVVFVGVGRGKVVGTAKRYAKARLAISHDRRKPIRVVQFDGGNGGG